MQSSLKQRVLAPLLSGDCISDIELTRRIGFQNPNSIQKTVEYLHRKGYITFDRSAKGISLSLVKSRTVMESIYDNRNFRELRPAIRSIPWFIEEMTQGFQILPGHLARDIREMMRVSPSFFAILRKTGSPEQVRERYQAFLFLIKLTGVTNPYFMEYCLYREIYLHCIYQDMSSEGLVAGWADLLTKIESEIKKQCMD